MPRYRSAGGLDDAVVDDGDVGFIGLNSRLPVYQLQPGFLSLSENGRIEGDWTPRRGVDIVADGSLSTGSPLRLPFWLVDDVGGDVVTAAERVDDVVTLTVPSHGFPVGGSSAASVIVNPTGADNSVLYTADASGAAGELISVEYSIQTGYSGLDVTVDGAAIEVVSGDSAMMTIGGTGEISGNPIGTIYLFKAASSNSFDRWLSENEEWVLESSGDDGIYELQYLPDGEGWVAPAASITPAGGVFQSSGGNTSGVPTVTASIASADQVRVAVNSDSIASALVTASASGTGTSPIAAVGPIFLQGGSGGAAYLGMEGIGGSPTIDPEGNWLMTPTDANTLTFQIPGATGSESYTVSGATVVIARLNDEAGSQVLGSCKFSDPSSNDDESVFLAYGGLVKQVALSDGTITDIGLPGSETLDGEIDLIQAFEKVYIFRDGKVAMEWNRGDTDFALVPSGAYTQPQVFEVTGTFVDVVSGLCTITGLTNSTVSAGDDILIYATTDPSFLEFVGNSYFVTAANGTSFSFYIPVKDLSTISTNTLSLGRQVSIGGGFIYQPGFRWATYFQRRLWGPYEYDWSTTPDPDGFVSRDIHDEVIASDILDGDTFDPIQNQFRITGGTADYIVAFQPFYEDALIVLNRNSIHGIFGTRGSLADTSVRELTREIGCVARKSVIGQGRFLFFLSDSGVYKFDFDEYYNLSGTQEPLSKDIQPYIDRISENLAELAVGTYFDNRYWLAVPLDSAPGQGDATGNNTILVYNLKNSAWESVDTFGDPSFYISNLIIGQAGARNDLYAITADGGIHVLNRLDQDYDNIATNAVLGAVQFPIVAALRTRGYLSGTPDRKRFADFGIQMKAGSSQCDVGLTLSTDDPDSDGAEVLASATNLGNAYPEGESADVRARTGGLRGYNGILTCRRVIGRPSIRGVRVTASGGARANLTQS